MSGRRWAFTRCRSEETCQDQSEARRRGHRDRPRPKRKAAKAARKQPAGKAPLGSLPAKRGRSAASPLPEFIEFATCLLVDRPPNGPDWVHEIKLDGLRPQIRFEDGTATLRTRNGHDYSSTFPELARIARGFDNCIIDGEVCFVRTA
jgi:bifunctional non-homologous end joining protein LigD